MVVFYVYFVGKMSEKLNYKYSNFLFIMHIVIANHYVICLEQISKIIFINCFDPIFVLMLKYKYLNRILIKTRKYTKLGMIALMSDSGAFLTRRLESAAKKM